MFLLQNFEGLVPFPFVNLNDLLMLVYVALAASTELRMKVIVYRKSISHYCFGSLEVCFQDKVKVVMIGSISKD